MVAPNRDLGNKQFSFSAFSSSASQMAHFPADSVMNIDNNQVDNYDNARGRNPSSSNVSSQSSSVVLNTSTILYHERMVINNSAPNEEFREPINSSQLSYKNNGQANGCVNKAIDPVSPQGPQNVSNEILALNISNPPCIDDNNVINIQLLYDPDQPTKLDIWDGNLHSISLHSSLEHLLSDSNNIKKSLVCMAKYIENKKIELSKANKINNFKGIGKAA